MNQDGEAQSNSPLGLVAIILRYRKIFFFAGLAWFALLVGPIDNL